MEFLPLTELERAFAKCSQVITARTVPKDLAGPAFFACVHAEIDKKAPNHPHHVYYPVDD